MHRPRREVAIAGATVPVFISMGGGTRNVTRPFVRPHLHFSIRSAFALLLLHTARTSIHIGFTQQLAAFLA